VDPTIDKPMDPMESEDTVVIPSIDDPMDTVIEDADAKEKIPPILSVVDSNREPIRVVPKRSSALIVEEKTKEKEN
ncbi:hypothetical protein PFISCL1PPCAC_24550, partial [Pristionchus fissidentatus]